MLRLAHHNNKTENEQRAEMKKPKTVMYNFATLDY